MMDIGESSPCENGAAISLENLSRSYGQRRAVDGVSLEVRRGEIFGLLGPNGSGKTTIFRILATLIQPSAGVARILGVDIAESPMSVRRQMGVAFQNPSLDLKLTVSENMIHQGHLFGIKGGLLRRRIDEVADSLGFSDRCRDRVERLSGGLRRRVELAKSLLHRPSVLLLDEPTAGLDPIVRRDFWRIVSDLRAREGVTVLTATHLMEEAQYTDRVAILDRGRLVALGGLRELTSEIASEVIDIRPAGSASELAEIVKNEFNLSASVVNGSVRIDSRDEQSGASLVAEVLRSHGNAIDSITLGKPTLEDVFIRKTGRRMSDANVNEDDG
jgi:ABC-2 type transport system ATP-binding protein